MQMRDLLAIAKFLIRALILYKRRRFINHLLTYLLTYLLIYLKNMKYKLTYISPHHVYF